MTLQAAVYQHLFIIILITLFFYGFIPILGAFFVRKKWRQFRSQLMKASLYPSLSYKAVHGSQKSGLFRIFGSLQAIQDENVLWITNEDVSVSLNLEGLPLYILSSATKDDSQIKNNIYPDESPQRTYWSSIFSLPEKTSFFVSGELVHKDGRSKFKNSKENPLLVIIYDCDDTEFYSHAILSGRQRNEYWNVLTPGTLTIGSFSLFIYFYFLIQMPYMHFVAVTALSFSIVPLLPFLPPGLFFYYIYRHLWKKARIIRAERDLLKLPLNYFTDKGELFHTNSVNLSSNSRYKCFIKSDKDAALALDKNSVFRTFSLIRSKKNRKEYFAFIAEETEQDDPMIESLVVQGNPNVLLRESTQTARIYEIISIFSFSLGFAMNFLIFLTAITIFIR